MLNYRTLFISLLVLANSKVALSYVENTTKGYANCMACHISPNGGGILNDYGRSLSAEMMSTWKVAKGFEKPFYGLGNNTNHVKWGGHLRTIQVYSENDQVKVKKQFVMQSNVEVAVRYMDAFLVGTAGRQEGPSTIDRKRQFLSERHYILKDVSDDSRLRVGKFRQHFGINQPNHTRLIKTRLGLGSNSEAYNLEYSKYFEWGEINTSFSIGDFMEKDPTKDEDKRNSAINFTHYMGGRSRLGASVLRERANLYKRKIYNLNAVFPLGDKIVGRSEVSYEVKNNIVSNKYTEAVKALYGDHTYGYYPFKGVFSYFVFEHGQSDVSDSSTLITSPGVGLQLLPIPHVEIQAEYQRRKYQRDTDNPEHRAFVTLHLYH